MGFSFYSCIVFHLYTSHNFLIDYSVVGCLGCFPILALPSVAMNMGVPRFFPMNFLCSGARYQEVVSLVHVGILILFYFADPQLVFHSGLHHVLTRSLTLPMNPSCTGCYLIPHKNSPPYSLLPCPYDVMVS